MSTIFFSLSILVCPITISITSNDTHKINKKSMRINQIAILRNQSGAGHRRGKGQLICCQYHLCSTVTKISIINNFTNTNNINIKVNENQSNSNFARGPRPNSITAWIKIQPNLIKNHLQFR